MFDFDGTITNKGVAVPSEKMAKTIIEAAKKVPVAFCTGRQLNSFKKHGITEFLKYLKKDEVIPFFKNLFLIAENGAMGYCYDFQKHKFKAFYRAEWPEKFIPRRSFKTRWHKEIKNFAEFLSHKIIIVTSIKNHHDLPIDKVYAASDKLYKMCHEFLSKISKNYEKYLHIGNSGLGILVSPAKADKDFGIRKFAQFLAHKRKLKFSPKISEILVIGDSAIYGGNDYYFLRGEYGTPYTVGSYDKSKKLPKPVFHNGKKLLHEKGTIYLLEKYITT